MYDIKYLLEANNFLCKCKEKTNRIVRPCKKCMSTKYLSSIEELINEGTRKVQEIKED